MVVIFKGLGFLINGPWVSLMLIPNSPTVDPEHVDELFTLSDGRRHCLDRCVGHYVKTLNRSRSICNGPLTPVTCTHICNCCYLMSITVKRGRPTPGWHPQRPLPMWTCNGLLKRPLHEFVVTDVK
jgi:hypothetical protein